MNGWTEEQVTALTTGTSTNDAKIDGLAGLVRKAAANSRNVTDATWKAAQQAGWSDEQLTDAFAYLGATVFTGYFRANRYGCLVVDRTELMPLPRRTRYAPRRRF